MGSGLCAGVLSALIGLLLLTGIPFSTSSARPIQVGDITPATERQATLEKVWQIVRDKHYDPKLNGVDWTAVYQRYRDKLPTIGSDDAFYTLLDQMLGELKQSHFSIIPPNVVVERAVPAQPGDLGITVRVINNQVVIATVKPGTNGAAKGLRPGFIINSIDGKSVGELRHRIMRRQLKPRMARFYLMVAVHNELFGAAGSDCILDVRDEHDRARMITVMREELSGEPVKFGNMPLSYQEFESRWIEPQIGYIRFNLFLMPMLPRIQSAIKQFHSAKGIIIDLRGNPGGLGALSVAIARHFYREQTLLGTMRLREGEHRFVVFPAPTPYDGPVVFLTDESSASTSEVLAGGMQESGRAVVVGERTAGAVLPSMFERLPDRSVLQFAMADFRTPKGILLEGVGVAPDYEVPLARPALLQGRDEALEKAREVILERNRSLTESSGKSR